MSAPKVTNRERIEQSAVENGWLWKGTHRTVIVSKGPRVLSLVFNTAGKLCAATGGGVQIRKEGSGSRPDSITDQVVRILQS